VRLLGVLTIAVVLASDAARAQTTNAPASATEDENVWSFSVAAYTYTLSDDRRYVQPTVTVDRDWLHLEVRGNYEALNTGSAWIGVNFSGGNTLEWELTPMLGGVFGDTAGIAPGFKGSLSWRRLEWYGETEYVVDSNIREDSFFYNWSELTLAPAEWFRFGMVTQRTRVYQSDREIQRGVMAGVSFKHVNVTGYVFDPDKDTRYVFAVQLTF
jgi:hypothetical protein